MRIRRAQINGTPGWCVDFGLRDGKRRRRYFTDYREAQDALRKGQRDAVALGRRWADLDPAERLDSFTVFQEIKAAGLTPRLVWDGYRTGVVKDAESPGMTLEKAIEELESSKLALNRRKDYVTTLKQYLTAWAKGQEQRTLASFTVNELQDYVNSRAAIGSRATAANRLGTLFSFAVKRGWITTNPCHRLELPKAADTLPTVLSNDDVKKLLRAARQHANGCLPWFVLGLFAGLRPEEADKVTWDSIDLKAATVIVHPATTKVRNARTVHLEPAAVAWLKLGGKLPVAKATRRKAMRAVRDAMGWEEWPKDVLRHTCASNFIALKKSYGAAAIELGNSESILRKHYRAEVSPAACADFWRLTPRAVK